MFSARHSFLALATCTLFIGPFAAAQTPKEIEVSTCTTTFVDRITYSTERTGVISVVPEEGDVVKLGEVIVRLNDQVPQAVLAVNQARAESEIEIEAAEKTAESARLEYDAAREANSVSSPSNPAYPATRLRRLKLDAEAAGLQVNQARHEKHLAELTRDQAQAELESFWVTSDVGGVVTRVFKHRGEGVQQGEPIVQVVNTDRLRIEGYIGIEDLYVKKGMPVKATFQVHNLEGDLEEVVLEAKLGFVDVSVGELTKQVRVWAEVDNSAGLLREGLGVEMVILPGYADTAN